MIRTAQRQVPWHWIILLCFTTSVQTLVDRCDDSMTLMLGKFIDNPFWIMAVGSLGIGLNFLISPYVSWKSDRIWTPLGRRKPFMLVGWALLGVAMFWAPFAGTLWIMLAVIILWNLGMDMGYNGPFSPLFYETVPTQQRGRGATIKKTMSVLASLFFGWFLMRQYSSKYDVPVPTWLNESGQLAFSGVHVIFCVVGFAVVLAWLNLAFNLKETKPEKPLPPERFNPYRFLREIFCDRQWLMIYLLLFCTVAVSANLGKLSALMITRQFNYPPEVLGTLSVAKTFYILLLAMPLALFLADRIERRTLFRIGLWLSTLQVLGLWVFIEFVGVPTVWQWIVLMAIGEIVDTLAGAAIEPLIFDLVRRNQMGTLNSGFLVVANILRMIIMLVIGLFVKYFSFWRYGESADSEAQVWDYSSGFLIVFALGVCGCICYAYFESQLRKGKIIEYGKLEHAEDQANPAKA